MALTVQRKAPLQAHNSMAVPASAVALVEVNNQEDLSAAFAFSQAEHLQTIILGEGSNTIFEKDFSGLVILNRIKGIEVIQRNASSALISVGSGENWHDFVRYCLSIDLFGLENLALIPGLVGAAPVQNIGAYGVEVKDCIDSVKIYDIASQKTRVLSQDECDFAYRDSCFKNDLLDKVVITAVVFKLSAEPDLQISYPALKKELSTNRSAQKLTPQNVFDAICKIRSAKLPQPKDIPNTGSFFKNPIVSAEQHQALKQRYPELVSFAIVGNSKFKLAAAWLIEYAGWKQQELDGVRVHCDQALVITNPLCKSGASVMNFARAIQKDIKQKFGLTLEIEPRVF